MGHLKGFIRPTFQNILFNPFRRDIRAGNASPRYRRNNGLQRFRNEASSGAFTELQHETFVVHTRRNAVTIKRNPHGQRTYDI